MASRLAARQSEVGIGVIALLGLGMFLNYVDRGSLATAAPLIKDQLRLTNTEAGVLLSAFFWTYTPFQLVAGWLAERWGPHRTLALGVGLWSLATFATGLVGSFAALLMLRLVLGAGESATFPCNAKILARGLPPERLGTANGAIGVGQALGPAVGTFGGGLLMAAYGWRAMFLAFGLISLLWLIPWLFTTKRDAAHVDGTAAPSPSYAAILGKRDFWGAALGHFAHNYSLYFILSWLPLYLVKTRGFTLAEMAALSGLLYIVYAIAVQASGLIADSLMASRCTGTQVRKGFTIVAQLGIAACMLCCVVGGAELSILALLASGLFFGMNTATIFPIGQTLGGPHAAGKWMGAQNCVGNIAGIIAPIVTGKLVDATGGFGYAFAVSGAVALAGALCWGLLLKRVEPVDGPDDADGQGRSDRDRVSDHHPAPGDRRASQPAGGRRHAARSESLGERGAAGVRFPRTRWARAEILRRSSPARGAGAALRLYPGRHDGRRCRLAVDTPHEDRHPRYSAGASRRCRP